MLRASFLRAARSASIRPALAIATRQTPALMQMKMNFVRAYSSENGLSKSDVETRVIDVLKSFDKVCHKFIVIFHSFHVFESRLTSYWF